MAMNCKPVPTLDERINDIRMRTAEIVNNDIIPNEGRLWAERREGESVHERTEVLELRADIKEKVKQAGLWAPHLPQEYGGMGLDFLAHAYMNEVLAYAIGAASLFGVVAPNSGNQSILVKYGTEEQKQQFLLPLIDGTMESGFSMTEPANAGSDPRSLTTSAVIEGDEFVINGHKGFTSNGIDADF
ncbi:MAG TPA: acyl-CoA dehydrogenase family protein, partial [Ilumatobacteraceae bacterium]|nr:acyl-CoA dehydrogenase family protein [Ilumatobacteraceae bacterium]